MTRPLVRSVLEQFDDREGRHCYRFALPGAPRTKKNHGKVVQRGRRKFHVPSDAFTAWQAGCLAHVLKNPVLKLGLESPVNCTAIFLRDRENGDAVGYYQGLADVLQHCGIVVDDKLVTQWDGSRLMRNPAGECCTAVTLTVLTATPKEAADGR